jgi:hypothetical protein
LSKLTRNQDLGGTNIAGEATSCAFTLFRGLSMFRVSVKSASLFLMNK